MDDLQDWLILRHAPGIGPRRYQQLLEYFSSPSACLAASERDWQRAGLPASAVDWLKQPDKKRVQNDLDWQKDEAHHILALNSPQYPELLKRIADPPPLLYIVGDPEVLSLPQLAVVGSRKASISGLETANQFAADLAGHGLTVTSGMARGIDAAAHEGALSVNGLTVAVAGTGPDRVYPAVHRDLAHRIAAEGAIVSEFPPGTDVRREHFPRRNRIISGLSLGVLVVEATVRSGSLITASLAAEQGREVFAIPGSIQNPMARGCHALIRQGGKLVEEVGHIFEEISALISIAEAPQTSAQEPVADPETELDDEYRHLLEKMGYEPISMDILSSRTGLAVNVLSSMMLILELNGMIESRPGGRYQRRLGGAQKNNP